MNKHLVRSVPVAMAVLFLSGQQLYAYGNYTTVDSLNSTSTSDFEAALNKQKQVMYLVQDSDIYQQATNTSVAIDHASKGSSLIIMGVDGEMCEVLTSNGLTGYIPVSRLTTSLENIFHTVNEVMYVMVDTDVKQQPSDSSTTVSTKVLNDEVHVIGKNEYNYWKIEEGGIVYYISSAALSDSPYIEEVEEEEELVEVVEVEETTTYTEVTPSSTWSGVALTPSAGVIIGPSGKESYYNLDMSGCVSIMHSYGFEGTYWVREDGVKMFGDYVMIAADYATRPRGTLLETSLGTGIVVDTGTFVYSNPTQIDIAVAW